MRVILLMLIGVTLQAGTGRCFGELDNKFISGDCLLQTTPRHKLTVNNSEVLPDKSFTVFAPNTKRINVFPMGSIHVLLHLNGQSSDKGWMTFVPTQGNFTTSGVQWIGHKTKVEFDGTVVRVEFE